ncbi:MAG: response regulator [Planctomycetes bacterium]|nr:response regulator [Planctomycetota bacterium]
MNALSGRLLVVDDNEMNRDMLSRRLQRKGHEVVTADDGAAALERIERETFDVVLLDIMMPGIDGYEVCRQIKSSPFGGFTLVALVSGRASTKERLQGYEAGADDYIVKPFNHDELAARVQILFRLRGTLLDLARTKGEVEVYNAKLEDLVRDRTAAVIETRNVTVFALAKLAESRDPETGEHLERMRSFTQILAEELAKTGPYTDEIDESFLTNLYMSSPLHDIGKVGIPDAILLKPGRLSISEFEIMQRHALIGAEALQDAENHTQSGGFLSMAVEIARFHHERFDGSGYPSGLAGCDIPLAARIVALADVYDALTSVRVYKSAFGTDVAKSMIENEEGKHFDPPIVQAFHSRYEDFVQVRKSCGVEDEKLVTA